MAFSRRTLTATTVVLLLALLVGGAYLRIRTQDDGGEGEANAAAVEGDGESVPASAPESFAADVAQPVSGAEAVRDTLRISVTATGEAAADRRSTLEARVRGTVRSVAVGENDRAAEGDVLLRLDTAELALALDRARAELRSAEAQYRELVLFDDEISDPEVRRERERIARARSGLDQAEVALREAELDLERATVRAPFDGRVADVQAVEGQHVSEGDELLTVVDLTPIRLEVRVLEAELGLMEVGRAATATFAAFPGETFRGRVRTTNPVVDPETRTARVTLTLPNPEGRIKPGMYARVALEARHFPDRILVPRDAILERDGRPMLFVFRPDSAGSAAGEGRSRWRYVTPGLENDSLVEIVDDPDTEMVEPGEIVLVEGHRYLTHDARVRLLEDPDAAERQRGR